MTIDEMDKITQEEEAKFVEIMKNEEENVLQSHHAVRTAGSSDTTSNEKVGFWSNKRVEEISQLIQR